MPKVMPVRMCVACRESKPKNELVRVVRIPSGEIMLDSSGKKPGRGAYICKSIECLKKAKKSKALERALGEIAGETYEALETAMEGALD